MPFFARRTWQRLLLSLPIGLSISVPSVAQAEPPEPADEAARALFSEGRTLVAEGDYENACTKFEQSLRQKVGIGAQFNLADCWQHVGRIASAYELFLAAARNAHRAGQAEREAAARDRALLLEPRVPRLAIEVDDPDPGLVVLRDQSIVAPAIWGVARVIDPGTYTLRATAPNREPWSTSVEIADSGELISIRVPRLKAARKTADQRVAADIFEPTLETEQSNSNAQVVIPLTLGAVGLSGLLAGTVFALHYHSTNERAEAICPASVNCSAAQVAAHDSFLSDARQARNLAFVSYGIGAMSLLTAAALYVHGGASARHSGFSAAPMIGENRSLGALLQGDF
ncbi:MAG TPA: hypothetical protein VHW01_05030 [Polyangiaceae bacterium]|jgi:hypothetical protein|nr:hypothetical protein [Polyangiaceae bacterium]